MAPARVHQTSTSGLLRAIASGGNAGPRGPSSSSTTRRNSEVSVSPKEKSTESLGRHCGSETAGDRSRSGRRCRRGEPDLLRRAHLAAVHSHLGPRADERRDPPDQHLIVGGIGDPLLAQLRPSGSGEPERPRHAIAPRHWPASSRFLSGSGAGTRSAAPAGQRRADRRRATRTGQRYPRSRPRAGVETHLSQPAHRR